MLFAGIAWTGEGFEVAFRDESGAVGAAPERFRARHLDELTERLRRVDEQVAPDLVCIVESTQGVVDGGLLAVGLRLHRADPWMLPSRPGFGSVDADTLARTGAARLTELPRLVPGESSLTGRAAEHAQHAKDSADTLATMAAEGRCLTRLPGGEADKMVALTFDDGPNPPWTGRILDILARYGVPATFFCVGLNATGHPDVLARMVEAGHGVGNHTWSHPFLPDLTASEVRAQVDRTTDAIAGVTGTRQPRLFRPPYGAGTPSIFSALGGDHDSTVVLWDVDTNDWAGPGAEAITTTVLGHVRPGSVVLMHDGGGDRSQTAEALPAVVEGLLERGYRFVRVADLLPGAGTKRSDAAGTARETATG